MSLDRCQCMAFSVLFKLFIYLFIYFIYMLAPLSLARLASGCNYFSVHLSSFFSSPLLLLLFFLFSYLIDIAIVSTISDITMALYCGHCTLFLYGFYRCLICKLLSVEQSMVTKMRLFRSLYTATALASLFFLCYV